MPTMTGPRLYDVHREAAWNFTGTILPLWADLTLEQQDRWDAFARELRDRDDDRISQARQEGFEDGMDSSARGVDLTDVPYA